MALLTFDATTVAPDTGFEALPPGWYNVMMTESERKPTKTEGGEYLECQFTILDGAAKGRKLFARYNIKNANAIAQEIGYKQLSAVCHAVGVLQISDSQLLHGKLLKVKIKVRKGNQDPANGETYEDSNDITIYKNINDVVEGGAPAGVTVAGGAGLPPGFAPQQWAGNPASVAASAPVAAPTLAAQPAAPVVAPVVVPPPVVAPPVAAAPALPPVKTMTAKAQGATYEAFLGQGWTDEMMVKEGYLTITTPVALPPAAPPVVPPVAAAPTTVGPAITAAALTPPWLQK